MPIHDLPPVNPQTYVSRIDDRERYRRACKQCRAPMPVAWVSVSDWKSAMIALCEGCILKLLTELAATLEAV